jgi:hypothetical protein
MIVSRSRWYAFAGRRIVFALHSGLDGRLLLRPHVALAGWIFADDDDGEARRDAEGLQFGGFTRNVGANGLGDGNAVDDRRNVPDGPGALGFGPHSISVQSRQPSSLE